jgi:putative ATP-dependent endonuclease of OLD family
MRISKVVIENFKCFKGRFSIELNAGLNIIVGDNESGKSTVLEAVHLALTGILNGRYVRNELTQYLFNNDTCRDYLHRLEQGKVVAPPYIRIEVFIDGGDCPMLMGDGNSDKTPACGISLTIAFDDKYQREYEELVKKGGIKTIPIEYYDAICTTFARDPVTSRTIPLKPALIDSSSSRYQNGSDIYISRIVREHLEPGEVVDISQAYRRLSETFMGDEAITAINKKLKTAARISNKAVTLSVDLSTRTAWEGSLMTFLDEIPFHNIGKGEQCIVKTKLALSHKKSKEANVILLEEPENHLSHTRLNQLIADVKAHCQDKQILISTHSSFVANKLGLQYLILLYGHNTVKLDDLDPDTREFFEKLSGYDTLRLILCTKAILVEGDSDELIVQKAYMVNHGNRLPIEDGIDVISVGTSFLRFLEIADKLAKPVAVVTDNDGDTEAITRKYEDYLGNNRKATIDICVDWTVDTGALMIGNSKFNYNTLEPKLVKTNGLSTLNKVLGVQFTAEDDLHTYMRNNKTECALKIYNTTETLSFPQYILDAIA